MELPGTGFDALDALEKHRRLRHAVIKHVSLVVEILIVVGTPSQLVAQK